MSKIQDKVVVIMGASSGIGEATTRKLAQEGAKLIIAARREERLKEIKDSIPEANLYYKAADVSNYEEVKNVIDLAMEKFGRVDVLFNNAAIMPTGPLVEARRDEWKQMLDINVMGVLNGIAATLPIMVEQQSGHIISTASVAGHVVYPNSAVYCGTKFAVRAIMEGLRQEHRLDNIRSTIISPGTVATELAGSIKKDDLREAELEYQKSIDPLQSEDVAKTVAFVIEASEHVSVSEMIVRPTQQPL
ncbi:SDR family oxidoreductase [Cytobacillus massiliigabonensis]|uniref:SDR family oxidoreductase n=1 Tax=Cytobacillus massiliigabonensis TaxID=1871011 RepID=UPI000C853906|nr:SDR family oxidoreductase [Cytobacillus massiliigabonensis]